MLIQGLPLKFWWRWIKMLLHPKPYIEYTKTLPDDHPGWKEGKKYQIRAILWLSLNFYAVLLMIVCAIIFLIIC